MNYAAYSTDDFLADESFQAFVRGSDPAAVQFWQGWAAQHPAQAAAFDEAVTVLQLIAPVRKPVPTALKQLELAKLWRSLPPAQPQPMLRTRRRQWAAALLAVVLCAGLGLCPGAPTGQQYATAGQPQQVQLPDGSQVTLNANSRLRLAAGWQPGQAREVWLEGEAYFKVRHTAPAALTTVTTAPADVKFTVHAGPLDVAVLGTEFDVRRRASRTDVVLSSGQIQLSRTRAGQREQLLMQPGELVEFDEALPPAPLAARRVDARSYSAWTNGQLDFDNTPVSEIVALLEKTYGLKVTLRNPSLAQQRLTGSVPNHDLDALLTSLGKSLDVQVRREGKRVWFE